jgi:hypothetical protein
MRVINGMHGIFNSLAASADKAHKIRSTSITMSGSGLFWHNVDSYFNPEGVGSYSFGNNPVGTRDGVRRGGRRPPLDPAGEFQ